MDVLARSTNAIQWQRSTGLKGKVIDLRQVIVRVVDQPETLTLTHAQQAILIVGACTDFNYQGLNNTSNQSNTGYMCVHVYKCAPRYQE